MLGVFSLAESINWSGIRPLCLEGAEVLNFFNSCIVFGASNTTIKKDIIAASPARNVTYLNRRKGPKNESR